MKEHQYQLCIKWLGNTGAGTVNYSGYKRDYEIIVQGKELIKGSSDTDFLGDPGRYNPEELLLASVSACHMLWYLHLCSGAGVIVTGYRDQPKGIMLETAGGGGKFTSIDLFPEVKLANISMTAEANSLHAKANALCFIANSLNFKIQHHPTCIHTEL